jgi:hypothetical protein
MIIQEIAEFETLVSEYMLLHPNAENPENWDYVIGIKKIVEFLKNANGREIEFVLSNNTSRLDGGYLRYIEN